MSLTTCISTHLPTNNTPTGIPIPSSPTADGTSNSGTNNDSPPGSTNIYLHSTSNEKTSVRLWPTPHSSGSKTSNSTDSDTMPANISPKATGDSSDRRSPPKSDMHHTSHAMVIHDDLTRTTYIVDYKTLWRFAYKKSTFFSFHAAKLQKIF